MLYDYLDICTITARLWHLRSCTCVRFTEIVYTVTKSNFLLSICALCLKLSPTSVACGWKSPARRVRGGIIGEACFLHLQVQCGGRGRLWRPGPGRQRLEDHTHRCLQVSPLQKPAVCRAGSGSSVPHPCHRWACVLIFTKTQQHVKTWTRTKNRYQGL